MQPLLWSNYLPDRDRNLFIIIIIIIIIINKRHFPLLGGLSKQF